MEIFERIATLRSSLGLTREKFGQNVDISINTIRAIETKGVTPKSDVLKKISAKWPCYSLWLLTGEDAPLAAQLSPVDEFSEFDGGNLSYQIIDVVDRNLDASIVKPGHVEKVLFLHTDNVPVSNKTDRILNTYHSSTGTRQKQSVNPTSSGTGMLLILSGEPKLGFKKAVLVKDGFFDIREIEKKGGIYGLLGDYKRWFESNGIRQFDIACVNHKTLFAARVESNELRASDLYPAANDLKPSYTQWCQSFSYDN